MRSVKGFKLISQQLSFGFLEDFTSLKWFEWDDVSANPSWKNKNKNGISLITTPVPIVCVFQGCVISSCWYFAQALLRILITACLISRFFERWALWSRADKCWAGWNERSAPHFWGVGLARALFPRFRWAWFLFANRKSYLLSVISGYNVK